jgi:hypothetical protein
MDYSIETARSAIMSTLCHMTQEQVAEVILEQQCSLLASERRCDDLDGHLESIRLQLSDALRFCGRQAPRTIENVVIAITRALVEEHRKNLIHEAEKPLSELGLLE